MQQAVRTGILRTFRSSIQSNGGERGSRASFSSQSAAVAAADLLDKEQVTIRVVDLLKSISFVDPSKVSRSANFKDELQLDRLENVQVVMAVEEEFAVDIPDTEANRFSTTAHLIDYVAAHPQAK